MKRLFIPVALCSLVFWSCQKQDGNIQMNTPESVQKFSSEDIYVSLPNSPEASATLADLGFEIEDLQSQTPSIANKSPNTHTHGHYSHQPPAPAPIPAFYKATTITFSGTENSQGLNGQAHWTRTWTDENGDDQTFTWTLTADCLYTDGSDAVYVGVLANETGTSPFSSSYIGARVWFKVKDLGKGPTNIDQYHPAVFWNSSGLIPCNAFDLNASIWQIPFIGVMTNVKNNSDNIVVQ